jgi:uncharacterized protein YbbK (DUF523 family)
MRLVDHPAFLDGLPRPTPEAPWRILISGCMAGWGCGVDGTDYGMGGALAALCALPTVRTVPFCPEDAGLGTPRSMPDLHGGDGFDVLEGRARVLDPDGTDMTAGMIAGAEQMLAAARAADVHLAILTDMSGACGTQVISDGCRFDTPRRYRRGVGVAAAVLSRAGIPVVSQRDHATLGRLRARLQPGYHPDPSARDHHEHPWVLEHLPDPSADGAAKAS